MKLADHVDLLRELIESAFDKQFARLGFGKAKQLDADKLPEDVRVKRERFVGMLDNHIAETGNYELAREKLLDELTFTLFNRFSAIKVMEAANLFPPVLTKQIEHGDRSFGHKAWLEINPHMRDEELEGIRDYLKSTFDDLGKTLPLYSKTYPYAMLPDTVSLNDIIDAFNTIEKDPQVGEEIWLSDDVLGWMYESYNNKKKQAHKDSKAKTEYNKVSLQSQVYTPRWVVQFLVENSLGKLYLEMYPDSEIKQRYKIANAPTEQTRTPKPLHEVRTIDPACGSGNFLLYAFDFYYELYLDQIENYDANYEEKDIPQLIIENNLHGIDLDDRAVQLAQLGLYIKAKKKRRNIGELNFRVVSSDFYLPDYDEVRHIFEQGTGVERNQKELIEKIWGDLQYAYKFGSLIQIDEQLKKQLSSIKERATDDLFAQAELMDHQDFSVNFFKNLAQAVEHYACTGRNTFLSSKTRDAITFLDLLTTEYDVATANPPYTDYSEFGSELKKFIDHNFKKPFNFHTNLYSAFIKRCFDLTGKDGKIALIHPDTFMFIKTFSGVRDFILNKTHINIFAHYPQTGGVFGIGIIYPAFYVLEKNLSKKESIFIDVSDSEGGREREVINFSRRLIDCIEGISNKNNYYINQDKFSIIKSNPFIYWISDTFRDKFKGAVLGDELHISEGFKSNDNQKILRYLWEIFPNFNSMSEKYFLYTKGGDSNKWHGNNWFVLKWENDGHNQLINGASLTSKDYYFKRGVTYSKSSNKGNSFRILEENVIFDSAAPSIFTLKNHNLNFILALMNSKLIQSIIKSLNPSVSSQVGDIKRVPIIKLSNSSEKLIENLVDDIIESKKSISSFYIIEPEYYSSCFARYKEARIIERAISFLNYSNFISSKILIIESIIDEMVFKAYGLIEHDKEMVLNKQGIILGSLPVSILARDAFLSEYKLNHKEIIDDVCEHIKSLPLKEFVSDEIELIEKNFSSLYQGNNSFEDFCTRYELNPINVWFWFKNSNVIPLQRIKNLAVEFIADIIREVLMDDNDGIVPLVSNSGEKILQDRVEEKILEKGFNLAQYSSFDSLLGLPVHDFINRYFFEALTEHLNLFQYLPKTPFIWHLTSGPEQGFDCYIIIYKWSRDNLQRLRSIYIENRERALINRQSDLSGNESADAQTDQERIFKQLKEIESFKKKIDELLAEGYNPILDDGVGKNIAPLQQKKMLAYDVLNAGQLKKYLNADW